MSCEMGGTAFDPCPCCTAAVITLVAGGVGFTATIQSQDGSMTATIRDDRWAPCPVIHVCPKLCMTWVGSVCVCTMHANIGYNPPPVSHSLPQTTPPLFFPVFLLFSAPSPSHPFFLQVPACDTQQCPQVKAVWVSRWLAAPCPCPHPRPPLVVLDRDFMAS